MADLRSYSQTPDAPVRPASMVDVELPGLPVALDAALLGARLAEAWRLDGDVLRCAPTYIRYKPGTSCIACYALQGPAEPDAAIVGNLFYAKCYRRTDFETAREKALMRSTVAGAAPQPVTSLDDLCTLVFAFPNDAELDGLQVLSEPKKVQRMLYEVVASHPETDWRISDRRLRITPVRYKPEKRAVLRLDTRAVHRITGERQPLTVYARTYVDDRGRHVARLMQAFTRTLPGDGRLRVPRAFGYHEERRMLLIEALGGIALRDILVTPEAGAATERTALALCRFHALEVDAGLLRESTATDLLDEARSAFPFLQGVSETAGRFVARIASELTSLAPAAERGMRFTVHGDFHQGQVLLARDAEAVIDFDRSFAGDPAADVGNFLAHLDLLQIEGHIGDAPELRERFIAAYSRASGNVIPPETLRFFRAVGLVQLSVRPFRTLQQNWRSRIERILATCAEGLA